ncbi:cupin domain-containing protein (plasmid) [Rhodococcus opacus]|uniref:Cupin domain-containing protein n=1 Tax=Rhodococcus jostii TaxID=132919 RepID=A0ABU4CSC4_RHOJO|nr:cupin domain-containing protein [Rhodococcus jostii]MDV6286482.1 cupin domain-containing protein [Rhodococcus jostii]
MSKSGEASRVSADSLDSLPFERYELPAESVIEGDPQVDVAPIWQSADDRIIVSTARFSSGTLDYAQTADELIYVVAGRMLVDDGSGKWVECSAGSLVRLSAGTTFRKQISDNYEEISIMYSDSPVVM